MKRLRALVNKEYFFVSLFVVISLFALTWFHGESFILAGDSSWPLDFKRFFELTTSVWDSSQAPGYNAPRQLASFFPYATYGLLAQKIGLTSDIFQKIVYVVSFFFSGYGFYLFSKNFNIGRTGSFFAGLIYMLSPYALIVAWNPTYGLSFPFYAYLPLCLSYFWKYMVGDSVFSKKLCEALFIFVFSFFGASLSNPVYFLLLIGLLVIVAGYIQLTDQKYKKIEFIKKTIVFVLCYVLLNSFWLIPSVVKSDYALADNVPLGLPDDFTTQYINSVSFKDGVRLLGLWTMFSEYLGDPYYVFNSLWKSPAYILISTLPIFIATYYVLRKRSLGNVFLLFSFIVAVAFNSGLRAPSFFENFIQPFFSIPFLSRAIRSVYLKLGFLLVIPLAILVGKAFEEKAARSMTIVTMLGFLIFSYPFFTGTIQRNQGSNMPSYGVTIPEDYYLAMDMVTEGERVFVFPIPPSYNYQLDWGDHGYIGADFLRQITKGSVYYIGSRPLSHYFSTTYDPEVLRQLAITYILVRKDIYENNYKPYLTDDPQLFKDRILNSTDIELLFDSTNLSLYKLTGNMGSSLIFIDDYRGVQFQNITPYKYSVTVPSGGGTLVFAETFDTDWSSYYIDHAGEKQMLKEHKLWENYANSWTLPNFELSQVVTIEFEAQRNFFLGLWLSALTIVFLGFLYLRRLRDE